MAINNPVAFVSESQSLINDVCSLLLGIPPEDFFSRYASESHQKTRYFKLNKGIFGHCLAYIGIVEDHAKGTLHYHLLFYGGLLPYVLQQFVELEEVCDAISATLNQMYQSSLPETTLVDWTMQQIVQNRNNYQLSSADLNVTNPDPILECSTPLDIISNSMVNFEDLKIKTCIQGANQQMHKHLLTC